MLSPFTVGVGLGAAGILGAATFLDQVEIRVPLLLLASAFACANLGAIAWSRRRSVEFEFTYSTFAAGFGPGRAGWLGVVASCVALSMVVFELVAHQIMH